MNEIVNKVANSKLEVFDLEDFFPKEKLYTLDISQFLFEGFVLKEKEFREQLKEYNWNQFENNYVSITCSTDAILPAWAFALVVAHLNSFSELVIQGSPKELLLAIYMDRLSKIDFSIYTNLPVILKGCSNKPVPQEMYVIAMQKLLPFARSIMFGEACSAVPLYKKA